MAKLKALEEQKEEKITLIPSPVKSKLEKFADEESKLVKGRFRCFESPGSRQRIMVKKYKNVRMFDMWMTDGEVYEIPLYVARHLNGVDITAGGMDGKIGSCSYPVHGFKWDSSQSLPPSTVGIGPDGQPGSIVPIVGVAKRVRRYGFESLEFDLGAI